ncbi:MAG TPA: protein kinase [Methylomirabilota bacterium]|nr:protein kinase [Methylomirabilota bacterium]
MTVLVAFLLLKHSHSRCGAVLTVATTPHKLSHYWLLEKIGSGGMGVVYRAHDEHLDRDVAVKVLPSAAAIEAFDSKARRALRREAHTLSRLNHSNIAQVYDFDREGDTDFIVMELVPGESLARKIANGPLSQELWLSIASQTVEGLAAAHARGIIHHDLKPSNLQIAPDGHVKILDFGLARFIRRKGLDIETATTVTEEEGLSGTLAYISPEQLRGEPCDERSDLWSAGVVLYEMATARLPFPGKTAASIADAILHSSMAPIPGGSASPLLCNIIERCLEKDVRQRYQTAGELSSDIRRVASGQVQLPVVRTDVTGQPRRIRTAALMVSVAVLLLASLLITGYARWRSKHFVPPQITSVAVLPLANLSEDQAQEYFSDGMTDAIINELSRASSLKVISRTSVMRYKNTRKPVPVIARELGVEALIEGSVVREGNRVRINAQLIYAPAEKRLWTDSFERDERNIISLQAEIAHAIMRQLQIRLATQSGSAQPSSVDPEAYDALLKARFYTYRVTVSDNAKAEQLARKAIGRQPDLGEADHILAEILWFQAMSLGTPSVAEARTLLEESRSAAEKAISLGANAHSTYALLLFTLLGDVDRAEKEYQLAIRLQPNLSSVHGHYGVYLTLVGRCVEARSELLRAVELDPTAEFAVGIAGEFLMYCKDLQSSEQYLREAMNLDPLYHRAQSVAETLYLVQHRIPEMLALVDASDRSDEEKSAIHQAISGGGEAGYRRWFLQRVLSDPRQNQRAFTVAAAYGLVEDRRHTLQYLGKAREQRDPRLRWVRALPQFWFLSGDPEFNRFLKQVGLPET